jgi:hypothetical protein
MVAICGKKGLEFFFRIHNLAAPGDRKQEIENRE